MNIIFINWACFCAYDVHEALYKLGHRIQDITITDKAHTEIDELFLADLSKQIKESHCELVFSLNYFPTVSIACQQNNCHYISWIYDNPQTKVYDQTATNSCNHIFTFDSYMAKQLNLRGVSTITYAPLAANVSRLTSSAITPKHIAKYQCEVSFVGSLYNESHNFYERLLSKAQTPYLTGYLEGILEAQKRVYGYNFLAECLTPEITKMIHKYMPYLPSEGSYIREEEIYADYYLAHRLATIERTELIYCLSEFFDVHLYTHEKVQIGKAKNRGNIAYMNEMPFLFRIAAINLNCTLRSIKNGIPLRAMDILGAGGFLLTNFQEDFLQHFEEDKHFVSYSTLQEALDKCDYYIEHEDARKRIANHALSLMEKEHTFEHRLQLILKQALTKKVHL